MTNKQKAFVDEIAAVLKKHRVTLKKTPVYYVGESEDVEFHIPDDTARGYVSMDTIADAIGGWDFVP